MAISLTRVAAFEFLIQFRSAGRSQIRNGIRSFARLKKSSLSLKKATDSQIRAANAYVESLKRLDNKTISSARAQRILKRSLDSAVGAKRRAALESIKQERAERGTRNLGRALGSRSTRFVRRIRGDEAAGKFAIKNAKLTTSLGSAAKRASSAFSKLSSRLAPIGILLSGIIGGVKAVIGAWASWARLNVYLAGTVGLLAFGLGSITDSFVKLGNRIRVASDGTSSLAETQSKLLSISNESRTAFKTVADLYGRVSINAKELGISQDEVLKLTELTAKAFKIAGGTAREEEQTIVQFAQALGSNRLSGDELRAVREQAPELSQSIARGLTAIGKFGTVTVGTLKTLGEQGVLTTKVVTEAIIQQERVINARFGRVQATFSDGLTAIRSSLQFFIGSVGDSIKLGPKFFRFFDKLSEKFNEISKTSGRFGLTLTNIPKLFNLLDLGFFKRVNTGFSGFSNSISNIPDKIESIANSINSFISFQSILRNRINPETGEKYKADEAIERAGRIAFGDGFAKFVKKIRRINDLFEGLLIQFETFLIVTKQLIPLIISGLRNLLKLFPNGQSRLDEFDSKVATEQFKKSKELNPETISRITKPLNTDFFTSKKEAKSGLETIDRIRENFKGDPAVIDRLNKIERNFTGLDIINKLPLVSLIDPAISFKNNIDIKALEFLISKMGSEVKDSIKEGMEGTTLKVDVPPSNDKSTSEREPSRSAGRK